jgi:hypothetical protein
MELSSRVLALHMWAALGLILSTAKHNKMKQSSQTSNLEINIIS